MDEQMMKTVAEFLQEMGLNFRSYSGRGMFGKTCVGVVCNDPIEVVTQMLVHFANEAIQAATDHNWYDAHPQPAECILFEELSNVLDKVCTDSMGLSQIVYFPKWKWNDALKCS